MRFLLSGILSGFLLAVPLLFAGEGGEEQTWQPKVYQDETITLIDAVRRSLAENPFIKLREEETRFQEGLWQELRGQFDSVLSGELSYDHFKEELRARQKQTQREIREKLQEGIEDLGEQISVNQSLLDEIVRLQQDPTGGRVSDPTLQALVDLFTAEIAQAENEAERQVLIRGRDEVVEEARENEVDLLTALRRDLDTDSTRLRNIGPAPTEQESFTGSLRVEYSKRLRNGIVLAPFFEYTLEGDRFVGKPTSRDFGGKGILDLYRSTVGFDLNVPLLRGRGKKSAAAGERAAEIGYEASRDTLRHVAALVARDTALAYWASVAAEERVRILAGSAGRQAKLVELTRDLIAGDFLAKVDLARAKARQTTVQGAVDEARRTAYEARVQLSSAIGLRVGNMEQAPKPADGFPAVPRGASLDEAALAPLVRDSAARRSDYQAALKLEAAGGVLVEAAQHDLKPRLDLFTSLSANALSETTAQESFSGNLMGPSYRIELSLEWPFENNTQKGRLAQARADKGIRAIDARELKRQIRSNVVRLFGSLQETLAQLHFTRQAIEHYQATIDNEKTKLGADESTLVAVLLTEERLTEAELAHAEAFRAYSRLVAELRFESGTLVSYDDGGQPLAEEAPVTIPAVR